MDRKEKILEELKEKTEIQVDVQFYKDLMKQPKDKLVGIVIQLTCKLQELLNKAEVIDESKLILPS